MAPESRGGQLLEGVLETDLRPDDLEVRLEAETDPGLGALHRAHAVRASQAPTVTCRQDMRRLNVAARRVGEGGAQEAWTSIVVSVPETERALRDDVIEAGRSFGGRLLPGVVCLEEARRGE